jgi:hypothetical protein
MNRVLHATTPFPNRLLDEAMPLLKDTEWRVLCIIVRQTLGWQDKQRQRRKERDWLTRAQLKARTGRNSEALAFAIDALIRQGYITAQDSKGQSLATPSERRKNHGRIYYGLTDGWTKDKRTSGGWRIKIEEKEGPGEAPKSELHSSTSSLLRVGDTKSELRGAGNSDTTKENATKETPTKGEDSLHPSIDAPGLNTSGPGKGESLPGFITLFETVAGQRDHEKSDTALSLCDAERLTALLDKHAALDWTPYLHLFFESDLSYVIGKGYSLSAFLNTCNIFLCQKPTRTVQRLPSH